MTDIEILTIVQLETQIAHSVMKERKPTSAIFARYVAIVMMHEQGIENKRIGYWFNMHPSNVTCALKTISGLLETNKHFKKMYKACGERMADMEEAV